MGHVNPFKCLQGMQDWTREPLNHCILREDARAWALWGCLGVGFKPFPFFFAVLFCFLCVVCLSLYITLSFFCLGSVSFLLLWPICIPFLFCLGHALSLYGLVGICSMVLVLWRHGGCLHIVWPFGLGAYYPHVLICCSFFCRTWI